MVTRLILLILLCVTTQAQFLFRKSAAFDAATSSGITYLINEQFEETDTGGALGTATDGYDSSLAGAEAGTLYPDYATSPAPLVGSQSLKLVGATGVIRYTLANETEIYVRARVVFNATPAASCSLIDVAEGTSTAQGVLGLTLGGKLRVINKGSQGDTTDSISPGTQYYVWFHWKSDGTAEGEFSTTSTRVGSGNKYKSVSGGVGTTAVTKFRLFAADANLTEVIFDDVKVSTTAWPTD